LPVPAEFANGLARLKKLSCFQFGSGMAFFCLGFEIGVK